MADNNPIDFALRVTESTAFSLHCVLGLLEPWTGCLRQALRDEGAMPSWFWPVAAAILGAVAVVNMIGSDTAILGAQCYIAAFHTGAVYFHVRLGHHPAAGCAPAVFVVLAVIVMALRTSFLFTVLASLGCGVVALILGQILVRPRRNRSEEAALFYDRS